jgi:hypothetical protein
MEGTEIAPLFPYEVGQPTICAVSSDGRNNCGFYRIQPWAGGVVPHSWKFRGHRSQAPSPFSRSLSGRPAVSLRRISRRAVRPELAADLTYRPQPGVYFHRRFALVFCHSSIVR